eukprot:g66299.t1
MGHFPNRIPPPLLIGNQNCFSDVEKEQKKLLGEKLFHRLLPSIECGVPFLFVFPVAIEDKPAASTTIQP